MNLYPAYFRKGPVCIKRETSRTGIQVDISESAEKNAFKILSSSEEDFDELVEKMEMVSFDVYERYLVLLHNRTQFEARSFRDTHHQTPEFLNPIPRRFYE